jgi:hypothetical protein
LDGEIRADSGASEVETEEAEAEAEAEEEEEEEEDRAHASDFVGFFKAGECDQLLLANSLAAFILGNGGKGGMARETGVVNSSFCLGGLWPLAFFWDAEREGVSAAAAAAACL